MTSSRQTHAPKAIAKYEPYIKIGNYIYISGQIPIENGKVADASIGKLGENLSLEDGKRIAKICANNLLLQLNHACDGDLKNVQCVKITVFVNSAADFTNQPLVADTVSETLLENLGEERGKHARAAVGVYQLPKGVAVEVDGVFAVENSN